MADNGEHNQNVLESALALRTARAIDEHIGRVEGVQRLAIEETLKDNEDLREQIVRAQAKTADLMNEFTSNQSTLLAEVSKLLADVSSLFVAMKDFTVPKTEVTLEAAPVTVNVPTPKLTVSPEINVPETKVVIDQKSETKQKPIKGATITHSDGSQSTVAIQR
jgi:Flp pilus assembly protein TadG